MSLVATRFEVRVYKPEDYVLAVSRGWCLGDPVTMGALWAKHGPAYTGFVNGEVAICAGIAQLFEGTWEAWAVLTPVGQQHPVFVHRGAIKGLRGLLDTHKPRRVQAHTNRREPQNGAWVEALGFKVEAILRKYGPDGADWVLWTMFP